MKKTKEAAKPKNIKLKPIVDAAIKYLALVILAGLAFKGVQSLVSASEAVCTFVGVLVVVLLVKTIIRA